MHYKLTTELTCRIAQTQNCLGLPVATKYAVFARSPHSHASTMGMLKKYFKKIKNNVITSFLSSISSGSCAPFEEHLSLLQLAMRPFQSLRHTIHTKTMIIWKAKIIYLDHDNSNNRPEGREDNQSDQK